MDFQEEKLKSEKWIVAEKISNQVLLDELSTRVDLGEAEAMVLAIELQADLLLIDEQAGRKVAEELGLTITGVLGILLVQDKK